MTKWELYIDNEVDEETGAVIGDGYEHHRCPNCKTPAIFTYETETLYDEDCDGEWTDCGSVEVGITENLTPFCPYCGICLEEDEHKNKKVKLLKTAYFDEDDCFDESNFKPNNLVSFGSVLHDVILSKNTEDAQERCRGFVIYEDGSMDEIVLREKRY